MRIFSLLLAVAGLLLLGAGCVCIDANDPNSPLPHNRPAEWENRTLGVPM